MRLGIKQARAVARRGGLQFMRNGEAERKQLFDQLFKWVHFLDQNAHQAHPAFYARALQWCAKLRALTEGKRIHEHAVQQNLDEDVLVANHILNMYGKCKSLNDARKVFDGIRFKNVVTWTAMIAAYAQQGYLHDAIDLFTNMKRQRLVEPNEITYISLLSACTTPASLEAGRMIHAWIVEDRYEPVVLVANALLNMYAKCGDLEDAWRIFLSMNQKNSSSWNAMITAAVKHGRNLQALYLLRWMLLIEGSVLLNDITFIAALNACSVPSLLSEGKFIHSLVGSTEYESDLILGTALVNMYGKCGDLQCARDMFNRMQEKNVVTWTAMITAYAQQGLVDEVLELYREMQKSKVAPTEATFVAMLEACAMRGKTALAQGEIVHAEATNNEWESHPFIMNALVNMYGKCGSVSGAKAVFDKISCKNIVAWTAVITAYAQAGHLFEAMNLFMAMKSDGIIPDKISLVTMLGVCASRGDAAEARWMRSQIDDAGVMSDHAVAVGLINMYGKCGCLDEAQDAFSIAQRSSTGKADDVVTWTSIITALTNHGCFHQAFLYFYKMQQHGSKPNRITFTNILSSCSHAGLINQGIALFASMVADHGIDPVQDHYVSVVDLLARVGCLDEAEDFLQRLPNSSVCSLMALLGACRDQGNAKELGNRLANRIFVEQPRFAPAYVALSNIS